MRISDWSSDVCSSDLLTQHAARILACRSGLRPETLRPGSDPQRQVRRLDDATGDEAGQRHFRGGNEPVIVGRAVEILAEFRKLARSVKGSGADQRRRSEEHTSELQSLMRISYAVFCLKKKKK